AAGRRTRGTSAFDESGHRGDVSGAVRVARTRPRPTWTCVDPARRRPSRVSASSARLSYGCRSTRGGPTMAERAMPSFKGSPPELIERFAPVLDRYPDAQRKQMFGYPAAFVGGNHATGLFHDRWVIRLPEADAAAA